MLSRQLSLVLKSFLLLFSIFYFLLEVRSYLFKSRLSMQLYGAHEPANFTKKLSSLLFLS